MRAALSKRFHNRDTFSANGLLLLRHCWEFNHYSYIQHTLVSLLRTVFCKVLHRVAEAFHQANQEQFRRPDFLTMIPC